MRDRTRARVVENGLVCVVGVGWGYLDEGSYSCKGAVVDEGPLGGGPGVNGGQVILLDQRTTSTTPYRCTTSTTPFRHCTSSTTPSCQHTTSTTSFYHRRTSCTSTSTSTTPFHQRTTTSSTTHIVIGLQWLSGAIEEEISIGRRCRHDSHSFCVLGELLKCFRRLGYGRS